MSEYKVAIIGCGSIGAIKNENVDSPITENILTHAHAVYCHSNTILHALVDQDKEKLLEAKRRWNSNKAFNSIDSFINDTDKYDIIIVATPTETHHEILSKVLDIRPKLIIAEKPFCDNINEVNTIQQKASTLNIPIMVNYIRRFNNGHIQVKKEIDSEKFGKVLNCSVRYTRGLKRDGCHAIDLMRYFFGGCPFFSKSKVNLIIDLSESDPTVFCTGVFKKCPHVVFLPCDGRQYGIFEIDICLERARIRLIDNGLYVEYYPITQENEWGHKSLSYKLTEVLRRETSLNISMYNVISNAVDFLDGRRDLLCTSEDAFEVHKIIG